MEKWKLKTYIKTTITVETLGFLGFSICFGSVYVLKVLGYLDIELDYLKLIGNLLLLFLSFIVISIIPAVLIYLITNAYKKKNEAEFKEYYRDIEKQYTPAIASFLIDYKIEGNEGVLATVLDLYIKKYLEIFKQNGKLEIKVINANTDELYLHEKYIIDCLNQKELIDIIKFKDRVEEDCIKNKLVNEKEISPYWFKIIKIELIIGAILVVLSDLFPQGIYEEALGINIIIFIMTIIAFVSVKRHIRTSKGEKLAIKFEGLKRFLKDYTLLPQRDIDYINISDRYLPFALALGVANKLENSYIECNKLISNYIKE